MKLLSDGKRCVCGNQLLNLGSGDFETLVQDDQIGAVDVRGSLAFLGVESTIQLWDCASRSQLDFCKSWGNNPSDISAISLQPECGYFGTESGNLLFY
jgi:hypothetical protein